jgi:hypothetical protein
VHPEDIGAPHCSIGINESVCVSTMVHLELKAGHIFCIEDDLSHKGRSCYDDD